MADGPMPPPLDRDALIRSLRPRRPWGGMITVAVLLAVGVGWMTFLGRRDRARGSRDAHSAAQAMADRMAASPEFRDWVLSHDVRRDGRAVIQRGLRRLDDATLRRRLELMAKVVTVGDVHRCAAMERGTASEDDTFALFDKLPPSDRDQFNEIIFRGAQADIKGSPPPRWVSLQRRTAFVSELRERLAKRPGGDKLLATLDHERAASDADVCALSRATYDVVNAMPDPLRITAGLLLIGGGAGGHALFDDRRWLMLDDDALIARAEVLEALLAQADEAGCAALARQAAPAGEVDALLQHTPARFQDRWYELSEQLDGATPPARSVTYAEMDRYWTAVIRRLARDRFDIRAFENPDDVSPASACRAHRLLVSALLRLPARLRAIGARAPAGGPPA